jgi:hypothetical protein
MGFKTLENEIFFEIFYINLNTIIERKISRFKKKILKTFVRIFPKILSPQ